MDVDVVRKMGLDPGFGGVSCAEVQGEAIVTYTIPSVVGIGTTDAGALNLAGVFRSGKRSRQPRKVAFEGIEYLVGHNVAEYARPIERMDFARFSDSPELRALIYTSLHQLIDTLPNSLSKKGQKTRVALAVGLPVEILQDKAQAAAIERDMASWLIGEHCFDVDGREAEFEVVAIRAKIAQPLATWFDWGFDVSGKWTKGAAAMKAPTLIVDEGFNTLDLLVVEGGKISTRYTGGDTLGMRRAAELAAVNIQRRYGVEMSLHEADELVQAVVNGGKAHTYVEGQPMDVTTQVRQACNTLVADVSRFVERKIGKGRKFKILVTGGGALALGNRLVRLYPHAEVVNDPVLANARGLAKLARRPGFLE